MFGRLKFKANSKPTGSALKQQNIFKKKEKNSEDTHLKALSTKSFIPVILMFFSWACIWTPSFKLLSTVKCDMTSGSKRGKEISGIPLSMCGRVFSKPSWAHFSNSGSCLWQGSVPKYSAEKIKNNWKVPFYVRQTNYCKNVVNNWEIIEINLISPQMYGFLRNYLCYFLFIGKIR